MLGALLTAFPALAASAAAAPLGGPVATPATPLATPAVPLTTSATPLTTSTAPATAPATTAAPLAAPLGDLVAGPQSRATKLSPPGAQSLVRGVDRVANRLFVEDFTHNALHQSDDWGVTFSEDKGLPADVPSISKILRFGPRLYAVGRSTATGLVGVYSAVPTPDSEPLQWTGPSITLNRGASVQGPGFTRGSRYLFLGEYGDPKPGPRVYRSSDGEHWTTVFGPARGVRHIHGLAPDPFHPGEVWMTLGDGVEAARRSTQYGAAGTWDVVIESSRFQSVQISFRPNRVFLAADSHSRTMFVAARKDLRVRAGTPQDIQDLRPPGSPPGTRYLFNAYFGAVDPDTGVYYCVANDDSENEPASAGAWQGMFAVRRAGGPVTILDPGGRGISMNGEVFIAGGRVFSGQWSIATVSSTS